MSGVHGNENDVETLRAALIGRSVTSVKLGSDFRKGYYQHAEGEVHLDDGSILYLGGNEGCGGCPSGHYSLDRLNDLPLNGITNVEVRVDDRPGPDEYDEYSSGDTTYRIFVLAADLPESVELATIEGSDGNGYYGTGFWFTVLPPTPAEEKDPNT